MERKTFNLPFVVYLIGFLFLSIAYYYFIARHSGYIYFWDASGAFAYRDPWQQYITTYSPYDGVEVGIKNRLPIVTVIFMITKSLTLFGLPEGEWAIKVAMWLVIIGAYTSFYFLFPRWKRVLGLNPVSKTTTSISLLVRLLVSLFYLCIPFYVYRMIHLHLFFLTTFYPLILYSFLSLTKIDNAHWKRSALLFVLANFFGLSSPHAIVYVLITLAFLSVTVGMRESWKNLFEISKRVLLAGIFVVLSNSYWLIPYLMEGIPVPGYVVHIGMYAFLGHATTLLNFLFDVSEWYIYQNNWINGFFSDSSFLLVIQYVGVYVFLSSAIAFCFNHLKKKQHQLWPIISLLILVALFVIKDSPLASFSQNTLLFSKFGWVIREPNRLKFIWSFWFFLFFALGLEEYMSKIIASMNKRTFMVRLIVMGITLLSLLLYFLPRTYLFSLYFVPTVISEEHSSMEDVFTSEENSWGGVLVYPREEGIKLIWKESTIPIADEGDYVFFPYNLPVPPVREASVLASQRSISDRLGQGFLSENLDVTPEILAKYGIQYVLIVKNPENVFSYLPDLSQQIADSISKIRSLDQFQEIFENSEYIVFKNTTLAYQIRSIEYIDTIEGLSVLEKVNLGADTKVRFIPISTSLIDINNRTKKLAYKDSIYPELDYYIASKSEEQLERISYYDKIKTRGTNIPWGRMSLADKTNGEAYIIFRNSNLFVSEYTRLDQAIYSDILLTDKRANVEALNLDQKVSCLGKSCSVFLKILYSPKGGDVELSFGSITKTINTYNSESSYKWLSVGNISSIQKDLHLRILPKSGLFSLADSLIIPEKDHNNMIDWWNSQDVVYVQRDQKDSTQLPSPEICRPQYTNLSSIYVFKRSKVNLKCSSLINLEFSNWQGENFLYKDAKNKKWSILKSSEQISNLDGTITLITRSNIILLLLYPLTVISIALGGIIVWNKEEDRT